MDDSAHVRREDNRPVFTERQVAKIIETSRRHLQYMKYLKRHGIPELVDAVREEELSVRAAADLARLPEEQQREALTKGKTEVRRVVAAMRKSRRNTLKHLLKLWDEADDIEQMVFLHAIGIVRIDDDDEGDDDDESDAKS